VAHNSTLLLCCLPTPLWCCLLTSSLFLGCMCMLPKIWSVRFRRMSDPAPPQHFNAPSDSMSLEDLDALLDLVTAAETPLPLATAVYTSMVGYCTPCDAFQARERRALLVRRLPDVSAALKRPSIVAIAAVLQPQAHCFLLIAVYTAMGDACPSAVAASNPATAAAVLSACNGLLESCMADAVAWAVSQPLVGRGASPHSLWMLAALLEAAVRQPEAVRLFTGCQAALLLGAAASLAAYMLAGATQLCGSATAGAPAAAQKEVDAWREGFEMATQAAVKLHILWSVRSEEQPVPPLPCVAADACCRLGCSLLSAVAEPGCCTQSAQQATVASGAGGLDTYFAAARDALLQVYSAEQLASAVSMLSSSILIGAMTALQPGFDSKAFDASAPAARQTLYALTGALLRSEQILVKVLPPAGTAASIGLSG